MVETTAMGAALAAGLAIGLWDIQSFKSESDTFVSSLSKQGNIISFLFKINS